MTIFGYTRAGANDSVVEIMEGCKCEHIFHDDNACANKNSEVLNSIIAMMGDGDVLLINKLSDLATNTTELLEIFTHVLKSGATIKTLSDCLNIKELSTLTMLETLIEFEKAIKNEKIKVGMNNAKRAGSKMGRPIAHPSKLQHALDLFVNSTYSINQIVKICGISKSTLYRKIKESGLERRV